MKPVHGAGATGGAEEAVEGRENEKEGWEAALHGKPPLPGCHIDGAKGGGGDG